MKKEFGFVLLIVLIILQVIILLGAYGFFSVIANLKSTEHLRQRNELLFQANNLLTQLEKNNLTADCQIPITAAAYLSLQRESWWQKNACQHVNDQQKIYYVHENLGANECAVIKNNLMNQIVTAQYDRITLYVTLKNTPAFRVILQSTVATPTNHLLTCPQVLHEVSAGRQSLRML